MAQETLPNKDTGAAIDKYKSDRSRVVGRDMLKSGLKAAAVGLFAAGAVVVSTSTLVVSAPAGLFLAGGLAAYGAAKMVEGGVKRAS